jgi:GNAT superfamily N-acetyltransferase
MRPTHQSRIGIRGSGTAANLSNVHELLAAYDRQVRRVSDFDGVERTDRVIRILLPHWRGVLWSNLDASTADAAIAGEIERFAGLGEFEWKYYSYDEPADLPDRLRAAGFKAEDTETLLMGEVRELPHESPLPDGVELREITDEAGVEAMARVNLEGFGEKADEGYLGQVLKEIRAGRTRMVVAYAGERPVSMGRVEFYAGTEFGGLYGGATVPDFRGQGIFRAVVAQRTTWAATAGVRYLQTDASDNSRPILERLGFIPVGTTTPYIHP